VCALRSTYITPNPDVGRIGLIILELSFAAEASSHPLTCLGVFHTALFSRLKINGVFFDLFDYSFLLDLALEPFQSDFDRFTFVYNYECQRVSPPLILGIAFIANLRLNVNPCIM
jgi:hypothetical protein